MSALPNEMTAIGIKTAGGPDMLVPSNARCQSPAAGEILVKVAAAGVNRPDVMQRMGLYPPPPGAPDIPGLEIAGEVVALGAGVKRWKIGDKSWRWWSAAATPNIALRMKSTRCRSRDSR